MNGDYQVHIPVDDQMGDGQRGSPVGEGVLGVPRLEVIEKTDTHCQPLAAGVFQEVILSRFTPARLLSRCIDIGVGRRRPRCHRRNIGGIVEGVEKYGPASSAVTPKPDSDGWVDPPVASFPNPSNHAGQVAPLTVKRVLPEQFRARVHPPVGSIPVAAGGSVVGKVDRQRRQTGLAQTITQPRNETPTSVTL